MGIQVNQQQGQERPHPRNSAQRCDGEFAEPSDQAVLAEQTGNCAEYTDPNHCIPGAVFVQHILPGQHVGYQ